jgi:hypothetical protein
MFTNKILISLSPFDPFPRIARQLDRKQCLSEDMATKRKGKQYPSKHYTENKRFRNANLTTKQG